MFDDRLVSPTDKILTFCVHCKTPAIQYYNCHNLDCDKLFICCLGCADKMRMTCSIGCKNSSRQRKIEVKRQTIAHVENYYAKIGIAQVRINQAVSFPHKFQFVGKTTFFEEEIKEACGFDGKMVSDACVGDVVTFRISSKVRKNDLVQV